MQRSTDRKNVHVPSSLIRFTQRQAFRVTGPSLWNELTSSIIRDSLFVPSLCSMRLLKSHYVILRLQSRECIWLEIERCYANAALHSQSTQQKECLIEMRSYLYKLFMIKLTSKFHYTCICMSWGRRRRWQIGNTLERHADKTGSRPIVALRWSQLYSIEARGGKMRISA